MHGNPFDLHVLRPEDGLPRELSGIGGIAGRRLQLVHNLAKPV